MRVTDSPASGVNVIGYLHEHSGLGEVARLVVAALANAGIPHDAVAVGSRPLGERLRRPALRFGTNIVCINASELPQFVEPLGRSLLRDRRTIGFWWWEVDRFPRSAALASHLVDEIWVGSEHVRQAVAAATAIDVRVFPVPLVPLSPSAHGIRPGEVASDRFTYLFAFNFSSAFERKNPLGLIDAYTRAFAADDGAQLVLKAMNGSIWPQQRGDVRRAAAERPDIVLLDRSFSPDAYRSLVAACDVYVSLHRAEGLGLTIAEAMSLGKPAIATAYSGNLEFMTDENSYLVPYELVPIPPGVSPYPEGAHWADPDLDAAAAAMRAAFDAPSDARARGERGRRELEEQHGLARASRFLDERLAAAPAPRDAPADPLELTAYELMWGPDLERARPWARRARGVLRPFLRPYLDHQRAVGAGLIEAIRERKSG
jgi:glycosyltransferase involved in cell wall biosynthesis